MKNINTIRKIVCFTLASLLFFACQKEELQIENTGKQITLANHENYSDDEIVLGDSINDPYRIDNMRIAFNQLISEGEIPPVPFLEPNFRYVKILPHNETELDAVEADTNLILFDYPLHYEVIVHGTYYHDPSVLDSTLTWLYGVLPLDYPIPSGVDAREIYQVFIPDIEDGVFYELLEERAYQITGNADDEDLFGNRNATNRNRASNFTPSATIRVYDDVVEGFIPLQGAKVTARRCTKIRSGITDCNGQCAVDGTFKYAVNYAIKWERAYWDIRNGCVQAYYDGPKIKNSWGLDIASGGKSLMLATIHRAAYKSFYGNNMGIQRPTLPVGKTKIHYKDSYGTGVYWGNWSVLGIFPDIKIWGINALGQYKSTNMVFGTTIHELGHQSHARFMGTVQFWQTTKFIYESWAEAVEWALTNHHYNVDLNVTYSHTMADRQSWHPNVISDIHYTPVFIDLMDNNNQGWVNVNYINDVISGYSLEEIQDYILPTAYGLSSLNTTLKSNKLHNETDSQIDYLLEKYWGLGF